MRRFWAAWRFLTAFPAPGLWGTAEKDLEGAVAFFPAVGLVLGLMAWMLSSVLVWLFPAWPTAALLVVSLALFSKGLHLDGLSDAADGLMSSRPKERMLEIMRDSHIGAMGVLAMVSCLMVKTSALASLQADNLAKVVLLVPLAGRCSLSVAMSCLPYVRSQAGLGTILYRGVTPRTGLWAGLTLFLVAGIVAGKGGLVAAGCVCALAGLFSLYCHRKIGGATGDTLGATCELAETVMALILAGFWGKG